MSIQIRIPQSHTNTSRTRNLVKQVASNGFLPVIALEACVEAGRTYQAYKRGGKDEARERIIEEFSGAVFWLGGVKALNALFEKVGQKILKLPNIAVDTASDDIRKPLDNFLQHETKANGEKILEKTMAKFKFVKVISSVVLANAFIGFALPKINQAITKTSRNKSHPQVDQSNSVQNDIVQIKNHQNLPSNNYFTMPTIDEFGQKQTDKNDKQNKNITFGSTLLSIANKFENDRNFQLISVDAGTASGRAFSARNNDERIEILFRDLGSVYFYMFNMVVMNSLLNKIQQKGIASRLDPVSAEFASKYMVNYIDDANNGKDVDSKKFIKDMLGTKKDLPQSLKDKFEGKDTKVITLDKFKEELKALVPQNKLKEFEKISEKMSELQPQIKGISYLTEGQVQDILSGGHINNPEFLQEFYKNRFGKKGLFKKAFSYDFMDKYKYFAQGDLDNLKKDLEQYVKTIVEQAKKSNNGIITKSLLEKASSHNLKINALNWGTGFVTSALFLSTIIPKLQYQITKWRTGSNEFPGTKELQ